MTDLNGPRSSDQCANYGIENYSKQVMYTEFIKTSKSRSLFFSGGHRFT